MIWLILATCGLVLGSRLMLPWRRISPVLDRWIFMGVLTLAGQVLILLVAGAGLHRLQRPVIIAGAGIWLSLGVLMHFLRRREEIPQPPTSNLWRQSGAWLAHNQLLLPVSIILILSMIALALAWTYLPPHAWDEIWYHLTPMAAWLQQGSITLLPEAALWSGYDPSSVDANQLAQDFSVAYNWANVYPLNAELNALWTMILTGTDQWADAAQLPYVITGALATAGLSRIGGASRPSALLASLLFLLTPMVLIHLRVAYVDAAFGSMMAASLYFLLRWREALSRCYAAMLGLSLGLAVGMKSTGVAFAAILGLGAVLIGLQEVRRGHLRGKSLALQAGLALAMLMAVGSYWYLRSWWTYGNPVYPVRLQLGGLVFPGLGSLNQLFMAHNTPTNYQGRNPLVTMAISWLELGDETYNYYSRNRGLGPVWAAFALPALVPFAFDAWRHRHVPRSLMLGLTALLLVIQPAPWWPRYVLYVVPVGLAALAWTYDRLHPMARSIAAFLILITLLTSTGLTMAETIEKLPLAMRLPRSQRTFGQLYYNDYAWVDGIPASRIGHTPMAWIYPLYGGLQNHVQLIDGKSQEVWRQAIETAQVDYLVVNYHFGPYDQWARSLATLLTPYREGDRFNVYKVQQ